MFFFFTCGTHTFSSRLAGAEHLTVQCQNCGNHSGRVMKRWQWFTLCFVPIIPFSIKPYKEVGCHICNFYQDIKYRPDVQAMMGNGAPGGQQPQSYAMAGGEQGKPAPPPQGQQGYYGPAPAGVPK
ncbi:hypothetical protein P280DRAFT_471477 [Massarina eburnea CBS 473.64]|uniref:Zinc-ribbon 15 domain-containing protein n=1 Tax=Massarina eburnea CBS 473.64 TaxID=1395130 RepID=A0A6A6RUG6_9PLEO|nr:hypothetical protein P280DRAFT_471477 [Massarina eburnea CBS 473.64]